MKDQPGLMEQMRRSQSEWEQVPSQNGVPMYDFITRAKGVDFTQKMQSGEWEDLTTQLAKYLPPELRLEQGERIIGHRWNRQRPYDPNR